MKTSNLIGFLILSLGIASGSTAADLSTKSVHAKNSHQVFGLGGLTIHGTVPDQEIRSSIIRKMDDKGIFVSHPEISYTYFSDDSAEDNGYQLHFMALKDCFDKPAVAAGWGKYIKDDKWRYGYLLALYAREKFVTTETFIQNGTTYTRQITQPKFLVSTDVGNWDLIFLPMLTFQYSVPITDKMNFSVMGGSNFLINHFSLGLEF